MARVRMYGRRSDEDQSAFSPEAQKRQCRDWCLANEHEIVGYYFDDDRSGAREDRPDFQRLLADALGDPDSLIVVHKFDRLARDTETALRVIYKVLKPKRVKVESVLERVDVWTALGKFIVTCSFGVSSYHNDNLATEVIKGLAEKYERGGVIGPVSFGYDWQYDRDSKGEKIRSTGRLVATADGPTVVDIFTRYATTNYSDLSLAVELNQEGFTFCARGRQDERRPFTSDTIGGILANRVYLGEVNYHGEWKPGNHAPLIDNELFERVAALRMRRRGVGRARNPATPRHETILREIAYCGECGARLHICMCGNQPHRTGYYRCGKKRNQGSCDAPQFRVQEADELVVSLLRELTIPPELANAALALAQRQFNQPKGAGIDRTKIQQQLDRLKTLFRLGDLSEAEYLRERAPLQAALAETPPAQRRFFDMQRATTLLSDLPTLLESATAEHRRALVHQVFSTVWITKAGVRAIRPAPAFRLLFWTLARGDAELVISTGLEPVTFSSGG